jgi:hypothetical protein
MSTRSGSTLDRARRPSADRGPDPLERVTVNLTARASRALEIATALTSLNKTDTINRAIQIYSYLEEITEAGGEIQVRATPDSELQVLKVF